MVECGAAWALLPVKEQQRIYNLFQEVVYEQSPDNIQPSEVVLVSSVELELPPTDPNKSDIYFLWVSIRSFL